MQTNSTQPIESQPRARVILEFIEGDLSRPPIIYPVTGGSYEQDEALRQEILKRWQSWGGRDV